jgi:transposase
MAWPKSLNAAGIIEKLKQKIASLQQQWRRENARLRQENERLRRREKQLEREQEQWQQERERLREENERLKRQLEEAQRASKRQAAPFSRGWRKANPKPPGRKSGAAYGQHHRKAIPKQVDEVIAVPAPARCECGGKLKVESIQPQYQQEIVRKTIWRRFDIPVCRCQACHKRVQGRDPRQTSDALGAAAVQLGSDALALAVQMNKGLGMPHADVAAVLKDGFQLQVNRSTVCRAVERVARRGEATWHALRDASRRSLVNSIDETGWNVAAQLRWLWVVVNEQITFCDMVEVASPAAARFPLQVEALLEKGLALRDRYSRQEISLHGLWTATGRLEAKLDRLLARSYQDAANRRLANHLQRERPYIFTYLYCPGLEATNNAAERALRPLVVARKNWGGNRTETGARAQAVLTSILQTAKQQGKNPLDLLIELLVGNEPAKILALVPPTREASQDSSPAPPRATMSDRRLWPSSSEFAVPLEFVALYATPASASDASASVQP